MNAEIKAGDRVSFDLEGNPKAPYGYGTVTRNFGGNILINPDHPIPGGFKMVNIVKVRDARFTQPFTVRRMP